MLMEWRNEVAAGSAKGMNKSFIAALLQCDSSTAVTKGFLTPKPTKGPNNKGKGVGVKGKGLDGHKGYPYAIQFQIPKGKKGKINNNKQYGNEIKDIPVFD